MGRFDFVRVRAPLRLICSDGHDRTGDDWQTKDLGCGMSSWSLGATLDGTLGDVEDEIQLPFTGQIAIYTQCIACPTLFDEIGQGGNVIVSSVEFEVELENSNVRGVKRIASSSEQLSAWIDAYGAEGPMTYAEAVAMMDTHVPNRARSLLRFLTKRVRGRWCAEPTDVEILAELIQRERALVTARDVDGETPLHHVIAQIRSDSSDAETGTLKALAKLILTEGADPNAKDNKGLTPLFFASTPCAAELLVQRGAHVNAANNRGNTVLMHAVHDRELSNALLTLGADPHQANPSGESAHSWSLLAQKEKP